LLIGIRPKANSKNRVGKLLNLILMKDEKTTETAIVASISAAGAGVGALIAASAGIAFAIPIAIGAGVACLGYAVAKTKA
jgi:hypothetical protein